MYRALTVRNLDAWYSAFGVQSVKHFTLRWSSACACSEGRLPETRFWRRGPNSTINPGLGTLLACRVRPDRALASGEMSTLSHRIQTFANSGLLAQIRRKATT
jgi:hypothetical protein